MTQKEYMIKSIPIGPSTIGPKGHFEGYASTPDIDQENDQIFPHAFEKSLTWWQTHKKRAPLLYWEHDPEEPIGLCSEIDEDAQGLRVKGQFLFALPKSQEVYQALQQGSNGLSIGFYIQKSHYKGKIRCITQAHLKEISVVQHPCNPHAYIHSYKNLPPKEDLQDIATLLDEIKRQLES